MTDYYVAAPDDTGHGYGNECPVYDTEGRQAGASEICGASLVR
jgi:hypothetical protein